MKKDIWKYILSLAVAVVLLYLSFREVKWDDFINALQKCRWWWIVAAMAAGVLSFWLRSLRWRKLILPIDPYMTAKAVFNAINIGYLANLALPRIGEFVRCGFITRNSSVGEHRRASYDKVLGTVVLERSWDVLTMFLLVGVVAMTMWGRFGDFFVNKVLVPFSGRMSSGLIIISVIVLSVIVLVWFLLRRYHNKRKPVSIVFKFMDGLWQGIISCLRMKNGWLFFVYTILIWLVYWFMSYAVLKAVQGMDPTGLPLEFSDALSKLAGMGASDALFLMLAGSLSSLVPVPGGFGAFHYIVAGALLSVYGVPFSVGIVFATLSHESQAVTMLISGTASYISESLSIVKDGNQSVNHQNME